MNENKNTQPKANSSNSYLRYSGMVMQLLVLLGLAAYGGQWLDAKMGNARPLVTALLLVAALLAYLVKIYFDLMKDS